MEALEIHEIENNDDSQSFLNENHGKIKKQCIKVYKLLAQGIVLTTGNAPSYGIRSLPRRIKDLRDQCGVKNIIDEWEYGLNEKGEMKRIQKKWWLQLPKVYPTKNDLQTWFNEFQQEQAPVIDISSHPKYSEQNLFPNYNP